MKRNLLFLLTVVILVCTCVVFIVELKFVEKLKDTEQEVIVPRNDISRGEDVSQEIYYKNDKSIPCPSGIAKSMNMNSFYELLKKRKQHELRVEKCTQEMWLYTSRRLRKVEINLKTNDYLNVTLKNIRAHYVSMQSRYNHLNTIYSEFEPYQLNWKYWQRNISIELGSLMKNRINYLQNPSDCKTAMKLICRVAKSCGFGCQIHHVAFCFIMAYATKRTLILDSANWRYSPKGWDAVFLPISSTCTKLPTGMLACNASSSLPHR